MSRRIPRALVASAMGGLLLVLSLGTPGYTAYGSHAFLMIAAYTAAAILT